MNNKQKKMIIGIVFTFIAVVSVSTFFFLSQPKFGSLPSGERLERILRSSNYYEGEFHNLTPTSMMTGNKNRWQTLWDFVFVNRENVRPDKPMPAIKTNLQQLPEAMDLMVWFGHSSYLLQVDSKKILVDPVFYEASPVSFINKPFEGTDIYQPDDLPDIDVLIITHDHWDHLDYQTVKSMQSRIRKVICPLGVGAHFERWGYSKEQVIELDWGDEFIHEGLTIHCLPARHFSGRGIRVNQSLWASFLLETQSLTLFLGGDGGYGDHFKLIGQKFPTIDWAILENGQYSADWKYIHIMPNELEKVLSDLDSKHAVTIHHSKYALSKHAWDEPIANEKLLREKTKFDLRPLLIGEILPLNH